MKSRNPQRKVLVTYFSPTYKNNIEKDKNVDYVMPLPWDIPGPMQSFIQHFRPISLLIARTDLWPECLYQCQKLRVPTRLFSCTKHKIKFWDRVLSILNLNPVEKIEKVYTVSEDDLKNMNQLHKGTQNKAIGDTRYDQVFYRLAQNNSIKESLFCQTPLKILMGSSWPADEERVLPALAAFVQQEKVQLIIAPHEPHPDHLRKIESQLKKHGIDFIYYTQSESGVASKAMIIDTVGVLADLYKLSDVAFVGGSFNGSVHSVMEPLAAGCPVFVGPDFKNNREAISFSKVPLDSTPLKVVHPVNTPNDINDYVSQMLDQDLSQLKQQVISLTETHKGSSKTLVELLITDKLI
ncbi:MAG: glycosyltransferase N-terminal domain-containing protein [Bdellovibrionales bacterium]